MDNQKNQTRVTIPKKIIELSTTDILSDVYIYFDGIDWFVDNDSSELQGIPCFGKINMDTKHRFFFPAHIKKVFDFTRLELIYFYVVNGRICFKSR